MAPRLLSQEPPGLALERPFLSATAPVLHPSRFARHAGGPGRGRTAVEPWRIALADGHPAATAAFNRRHCRVESAGPGRDGGAQRGVFGAAVAAHALARGGCTCPPSQKAHPFPLAFAGPLWSLRTAYAISV